MEEICNLPNSIFSEMFETKSIIHSSIPSSTNVRRPMRGSLAQLPPGRPDGAAVDRDDAGDGVRELVERHRRACHSRASNPGLQAKLLVE